MNNPENANYWTYSFYVDPTLNDGFDTVFKQGNEDWWWYTKEGDSNCPAAGPTPDFTGATFKSLHQWTKKVL